MMAPRFKSGRKAKIFSASAIENVVAAPARAAGMTPLSDEALALGNWPVPTRPGVFNAPVDKKLIPKSVSTARFSSAKRTRRMICFSPAPGATCRLLTTVLLKGAVNASARSATAWLLTCPMSDKASRLARTSMVSPGKVSRSKSRTGSRFGSTVTVKNSGSPARCQITRLDKPSDLAFTKISRLVTATASITSGLPIETRAMSPGRSITMLFPTVSFMRSPAGSETGESCASRRAVETSASTAPRRHRDPTPFEKPIPSTSGIARSILPVRRDRLLQAHHLHALLVAADKDDLVAGRRRRGLDQRWLSRLGARSAARPLGNWRRGRFGFAGAAVEVHQFLALGGFHLLIVGVAQDQLNLALVIGERQNLGLLRRYQQRHQRGVNGLAARFGL